MPLNFWTLKSVLTAQNNTLRRDNFIAAETIILKVQFLPHTNRGWYIYDSSCSKTQND